MLRTASCYKEQPTVSTCPGSPDVIVGPGQIDESWYIFINNAAF